MKLLKKFKINNEINYHLPQEHSANATVHVSQVGHDLGMRRSTESMRRHHPMYKD